MLNMTVLIIADDSEFSRDVTSRWQTERNVPTFTLVSSTVWQGAAGGFDLALLGPMPLEQLLAVARILAASSSAPVLCVIDDAAAAKALRDEFPRVLVLRQYQGWLDATVLLAAEILRRVEATARTNEAEEAAAQVRRQATLGRYMLEMRHSFNNALTSVLGNTELLLLEPGNFSAEVRDQLDTIHSMALRMHEILQRFSSLDTEMRFAEKSSHSETAARAQGYVPG